MKKLLVICILLIMYTKPVFAENTIDYSEIEKSVQQQTGQKISIEELVDSFQNGEMLHIIGKMFAEKIKQSFKEEIELRELFIQMLFVGFMIAIFQNLSKSFLEQYIGTTGFYIVYMVLSGIMIRQFLITYEFARDSLDQILTFMKVLVPTYSMILLGVTGITTSAASYELFFVLMTAVQWGIIYMILPAIKIGFILKLINFLANEDLFSGLVDVLESLIRLLLKGAIMIVLLFNIFQSMLLPAIDSVKSNLIQKGLGVLPGIGQVFGMIANTAIGSGIILKNAIGVFGMIVICLIVFVPSVKIFVYAESFQIAGAVLQPVTEKYVYQMFKSVSESGKLLLQAVLTAAVLFLLTIAIISTTTNMNYYVG
ncbi:MAG: stage III sporulation protein AE [Lachnospiraceae bacterium]|nr:stage III sporulation protein AE [Lachnospiraceae bacterium]